MANDNLSGVILWGLLLKALSSKNLSKKYRFVIAPETIGALCFKIAKDIASKFTAGLILTTVGGSAPVSLKSSFCQYKARSIRASSSYATKQTTG